MTAIESDGWLKPGDRVQIGSDGVIIATLTIESIDRTTRKLTFKEKVPKVVCAGCEMRLAPE
jgi:hypothetical protein